MVLSIGPLIAIAAAVVAAYCADYEPRNALFPISDKGHYAVKSYSRGCDLSFQIPGRPVTAQEGQHGSTLDPLQLNMLHTQLIAPRLNALRSAVPASQSIIDAPDVTTIKVEAGYPIPALTGIMRARFDEILGTWICNSEGSVILDAPIATGAPGIRVIPLTPVWTGLISSSIFVWLILGVAALALNGAIRLRRSARNRCVACGYQLYSSMRRCSECGRPTRPVTMDFAEYYHLRGRAFITTAAVGAIAILSSIHGIATAAFVLWLLWICGTAIKSQPAGDFERSRIKRHWALLMLCGIALGEYLAATAPRLGIESAHFAAACDDTSESGIGHRCLDRDLAMVLDCAYSVPSVGVYEMLSLDMAFDAWTEERGELPAGPDREILRSLMMRMQSESQVYDDCSLRLMRVLRKLVGTIPRSK